MRKPISILIAGWLLIVALCIGCGMCGITGCRTVDLQKTTSNVDSTVAQKNTYDSTTASLYERLFSHYKEVAREYRPGKDCVIYKDGEPQIIQAPGQLIREVIRERSDGKEKATQNTTVSRTDSLLIALLSKDTTKEKETSSIPAWGWAVIGIVGYFLLKDLTSGGSFFKPKNRQL